MLAAGHGTMAPGALDRHLGTRSQRSLAHLWQLTASRRMQLWFTRHLHTSTSPGRDTKIR